MRKALQTTALNLTILLLFSAACHGEQSASVDGWDRAIATLESQANNKNWTYIPRLADKARSGDASAQFELGVAYASGKLVVKDWGNAIKYFRLAAEQGHIDAQYNLAVLFSKQSKKTEADLVESVKWWKLAADHGHVESQVSLAYAYKFGEGIEKNLPESFRWAEKAARQNNPAAQFSLFADYADGMGIPKDEVKALEWLKKSADNGHPVAQLYLGHAYSSGTYGLAKNSATAFKLWLQAASYGLSDAQVRIGVAYQRGEGVEPNSIESLKWFLLAAKQGSSAANNIVSILKQDLPEETVREAQNRADSWKKTPR